MRIAMKPSSRCPVRFRPSLGLFLVLAGGVAGFAQTPFLKSTEVGPDQSVTFRYFAPTAREVTLSLDYDHHPLPLKKGDDGVWTLTTAPLPAAVHMYSLTVDGVAILDPLNRSSSRRQRPDFPDQSRAGPQADAPALGPDRRPARRGPPSHVPFGDHPGTEGRDGGLLCLHSARVRCRRREAVPGALFAPRLEFAGGFLAGGRPGQPDARQPLGAGRGAPDDRRHAAGLRRHELRSRTDSSNGRTRPRSPTTEDFSATRF